MNRERFLCCIVVAAAVVLAVVWFSYNNIDSQLKQISQKMNEGLPDTSNPSAIVQKTQSLPDKKFVFFVKIPDYSAKDLGSIEKFKDLIYQRLSSKLKTEPDFDFFRKNDVSILYSYSDKDDKELFVLEFSPTDYS